MPLSGQTKQKFDAAADRLKNFYEGQRPYDPVDNPGGLRRGGNVVNFAPALSDVAEVGSSIGVLASEVSQTAIVVAEKAAATAAASDQARAAADRADATVDGRLAINYRATGGTADRSALDRAGDRLSVYDFGVKADGRYVSDFLTVTAADPRKLVIYTDTFVASDVGKYLEVPGAGPSGGVLRTTISAVNGPQSVQMAAAASTMLPGNVRASLLFGTDDTAAFQAAGDFCAVNGKRLDFASQTICLVRNFNTKDTERSTYTASSLVPTIAGRGSTLRKIPGGDDTYLVAPERWVNNVAFYQQPCRIFDLVMDGGGIARDVCVVAGYFCDYRGSKANNGTRDGFNLATLTRNGTTALTGPAVENSFENTAGSGNGRCGFYNPVGSGYTDYHLSGFYFNNGAFNLTLGQCAGANIKVHTYHTIAGICDGGVYIGSTYGAAFDGSIFEGDLNNPAGDKPCCVIGGSTPGAGLSGVTFWSRVRCDFAVSCNTIQLHKNSFVGPAHIYHNGSASQRIFSKQNMFETATPYAFASAASIINADCDTSEKGGQIYNGPQRQGSPRILTSNTEKFLTPGADPYAVALTDPDILIIGAALTQAYNIDLPTGATAGRVIRFIRPSYAGGAFAANIRVNGTAIKALTAANQWTEFRTTSGGGWYLYGSGTL